MNLKGINSQALLMVLGCLVPMGAIAAVVLFGIPLDTVVVFGLVLLCPLMHLFMMRGMGHSHADHGQVVDGQARPATSTGSRALSDARAAPGSAKQESCH